jgi:cell division protein FtsQ
LAGGTIEFYAIDGRVQTNGHENALRSGDERLAPTRGSRSKVEQLRMELSLPFSTRPRRTRVTRRRSAARWDRVLAWLPNDSLASRVAVCALLAVPLLGGGWLWVRNSSLVSVRHVHISGVEGVDAQQIRTALDAAAKRMTTMDLDPGSLRSAVASFAIVKSLRVTTSFPHTVHISVTEQPPVAALLSAGQRTAIAADGTVLGPALLSSSLPLLTGSYEPPAGAHVHEAGVLADVAVLGAAPQPLARYVERVYNGPEGLTVAMRNGLLVYFGDAMRPHAKWLSLARVLVSPSSSGASYIDVRLPERPAAGFSSASPSSPTSSSPTSSSAAATAVQAGASEPTTASLAASLENAVGGGAAPTPSAPETSGSAQSEASSSSEGQASGAGESEAPPSG